MSGIYVKRAISAEPKKFSYVTDKIIGGVAEEMPF